MKSTEQRLVALESMLTHLQRTVQDLDQVIIDQGRRIDQLQREVKVVVQDLGTVRETNRETRRAEDEIPPHY